MIVLDASALLDVLLDQPAKAWVLDQLADGPIIAPAHQLAEVASALGRLIRAGTLEPSAAREAAGSAAALEQELVPPTAMHLRQALNGQDRVRVLDGLYVALARARDIPLVTTDRRLARAGLDVAVRSPDGR